MKKITLTLDETDVRSLTLAMISIRATFELEAEEAPTAELREMNAKTAEMWKRIRQEIRAQYKAQKED